MRIFLIVVALLVSAACFAQPDYAREKRWAGEITPGLVVGDTVYLAQKSGHKFLAIYTAATQSRAAVITVHGMGVHPDWALIGTLRSGLSDHGYATLSVQMPVLDIYGERDFPQVLQQANARAAVLKTLKGSAQIEVAGADHFFAGHEGELVRQVKQFLDLRLR